MNTSVILRCSSCGCRIPAEVFASSRDGSCPSCGHALQAVVLPALTRKSGAPPALPSDDPPSPGEPVCFYSPGRRAVNSCSHCGVFISEAWSAQWGAECVCLKCLDELRGKRKDVRFESSRVLWDNVALGLALLPFLSCVPLLFLGPVGAVLMIFCAMASIVTAPLAFGFSIYAWRKPRSLVPRGPWRVVWAFVLSFLQCAGWVAVIISGVSRSAIFSGVS